MFDFFITLILISPSLPFPNSLPPHALISALFPFLNSLSPYLRGCSKATKTFTSFKLRYFVPIFSFPHKNICKT